MDCKDDVGIDCKDDAGFVDDEDVSEDLTLDTVDAADSTADAVLDEEAATTPDDETLSLSLAVVLLDTAELSIPELETTELEDEELSV